MSRYGIYYHGNIYEGEVPINVYDRLGNGGYIAVNIDDVALFLTKEQVIELIDKLNEVI